MTLPASRMTPYGRRGQVVRVVYLVIAAAAWLLGRIRRRADNGAIVLCYHNVAARQTSQFAWQMRAIAKGAASLDEIARRPFATKRMIGVTFDDGFASLLNHAMPALEEYSVPALVFVVTGQAGDVPRWEMRPGHPDALEPMMTADQIRTLDEHDLIRIESHTVSHPDLRTLGAPQLVYELEHARRTLAAWVGRPVTELAVPFGAHDTRVRHAIREAGYDRIHTLEAHPAQALEAGECIGRFSVSPDMWRVEFRLTIAGGYAWLHAWRRWRRTRKAASEARIELPERVAA